MKTIQSEVIEKGLKRFDKDELEKLNTKRSARPKEAFSRREIEELMGTKRPTYRRVGGAIRNNR